MAVGTWVVAAAEADPQPTPAQIDAEEKRRVIGGSAERIEGEEESESQGEAAEDQHVFLAGGHPIDPDAEIEVFLKTTGFGAGADVAEGRLAAAADRTAKASWIEILKGCPGLDPNLFHPFFRVVDVSTAAALETVGAGIR